MHKFKPGVPVVTTESLIVVDPGLKPGIHRFQLVVVNNKQRQSLPTIHSILVLKTKPPSHPQKEEKEEKKREEPPAHKKEPAKPKKPRRKNP